MKKCNVCELIKPLNHFSKDKSRADGFNYKCKDCNNKIRNNHYKNNKEKTLAYNKQWKQNNKEKYLLSELNRERIRFKEDIIFKLKKRLRNRMFYAIKNNQKSGSAIQDLGCTTEFLKQYLESKFQPGMTWSNWGLGPGKWQLDHIKPLCNFDLTNRTQFLYACNYTNLQPLWHEDHLIKTQKDIESR